MSNRTRVALEIPPNLTDASVDQVQAALKNAQAAFNRTLQLPPEFLALQNTLRNSDRELVEEVVKSLVKEGVIDYQIAIQNIQNNEDEEVEPDNDPDESDGEDPDNNPDEIESNEFTAGMPTVEEFGKMSKHLPNMGVGKTREDFIKVSFVASNNFLWHSKGAWSPNALQTMTVQYPGRPFLIDHSWSVKDARGFVYDSLYVINRKVKRGILEQVDSKSNTDIFNKDGYQELITHVAFDKSCQFSDELMAGVYSDVSTGCNVNTDTYQCPIDGTYFGEGDRWYQCAHGHNMPSFYLEYWYYNEEQKNNMAPYYIITEVTSTIELSAVVMGNLPAASIIRKRSTK